MQLPDPGKITVDKFQFLFLKDKEVETDMLRLDKIHPVISGNKWFKLKYHLENFSKENHSGILTFGGAWSNHIVATACACHIKKIRCTGIIRGEKPQQPSATLLQAIEYGMQLAFVSRDSYKQRNNPGFTDELKKWYPGYYLIPEGGAGPEGEKGAGEILNFINKDDYSHIVCAVGTATMFNGIANAVTANQQITGIPVLKGMNEITGKPSLKIFNDYHFGGYAKHTPELIHFMNDFYRHTNIPTDFVYTGKLVFAMADLVKKNFFPPGSRVLIIHSGGLQGNASLPKGTLIF